MVGVVLVAMVVASCSPGTSTRDGTVLPDVTPPPTRVLDDPSGVVAEWSVRRVEPETFPQNAVSTTSVTVYFVGRFCDQHVWVTVTRPQQGQGLSVVVQSQDYLNSATVCGDMNKTYEVQIEFDREVDPDLVEITTERLAIDATT